MVFSLCDKMVVFDNINDFRIYVFIGILLIFYQERYYMEYKYLHY